MNILFDISTLGAGNFDVRAQTGIFRVVQNLARGLARAPGIELTLCAPESFILLLESLKFLKTEDILRHHNFSVPTNAFFPAGRRATEALQTLIKQHEKQYGRTAISAKLLRTARMLVNKSIKALEILDPDLLLDKKYLNTADIYHSPFHPFPANLHRDAPHLIRFMTIHDLIPIKFPQYFAFNEQQTIRRTLAALDQRDWILCVSQSTRNDLLEHRPDLDPNKVLVTELACSDLFYPCKDHDRCQAVRRKYGIPPQATYFLSLSTLEPRKNIVTTIRAFARLHQYIKDRDLFLVLAGPTGWDYSAIFEEVQKGPDLQQQIIFPGFIADQDLAPLYSDALAFLYPSLYEGFGLPPLEAMQCGTPVITSNTSSLPEVVGDAGIMIDPEDSEALAQQMGELYNKPELVTDLSEKSQGQAGRFSWDQCVAKITKAYALALNS